MPCSTAASDSASASCAPVSSAPPFRVDAPPSTFATGAGRIAYTDVGSGPPVVFLHGNPTSAYLYRHLVDGLAPRHRCIAPDYLGFGRSDRPPDFSYRPPAHAAQIEALLRSLDLDRLTLVAHDWGGPIALAFALRHPDRIRRLILFNTWGWPHDRDPWIGAFSLLAGGPVGRALIERYNAFARWIVPLAVADRDRLSPQALERYAAPFDTPEQRRPTWAFARALLAETRWLRALWRRRHRLAGVPALLVWGTRDPAFGHERYLRRWVRLFDAPVVRRLPLGHYVPEEGGPSLVPLVRAFARPPRPGDRERNLIRPPS